MIFPRQIMYDQASSKTIFAEVRVLMRTNLWELVSLSISSQAEPAGGTLYMLQILFPFFSPKTGNLFSIPPSTL
jgi:hypothetical protein